MRALLIVWGVALSQVAALPAWALVNAPKPLLRQRIERSVGIYSGVETGCRDTTAQVRVTQVRRGPPRKSLFVTRTQWTDTVFSCMEPSRQTVLVLCESLQRGRCEPVPYGYFSLHEPHEVELQQRVVVGLKLEGEDAWRLWTVENFRRGSTRDDATRALFWTNPLSGKKARERMALTDEEWNLLVNAYVAEPSWGDEIYAMITLRPDLLKRPGVGHAVVRAIDEELKHTGLPIEFMVTFGALLDAAELPKTDCWASRIPDKPARLRQHWQDMRKLLRTPVPSPPTHPKE